MGADNDNSLRQRHVRAFDQADDVLDIENVVSRMVSLGGMAIARNVHQPGWRWSEHVQPIVKTDRCETHHMGVSLSGRVRVQDITAGEYEIGPWEVFDVHPGHDAWVVGDEPWVSVDWTGVRSWIPSWDVLADRVLATLVFTDIVGSTEMARHMGDVAWGELMNVHEARVRDTLARFRGREVKPTGDGVLAVFDSPVRAVHSAVALQEVAAGLQLSIRAGVHTGEVEVTDTDLRGLAVHEAARIMSLAGPSEVLVSSTTRSLIEDSGFVFEDRGEHSLKGLPAPRRVYAVVG